MSAVTFDILECVKTLQAAGLPSQQAEAIASAVRKANASSDVATKGDIALVRKDADAIRSELAVHRWMLGFVVAGVLSLVVKTFFEP